MGISATLHWHNAPVSSPNGMQTIQQRIIDQYGYNQSQSSWNLQIRTHRPGQAPSNQAQSERPEILTVVTFPRSVAPTTKDVVFSITTYVVGVANGQADPTSSMNTTETTFANSRRWDIERDPTYQTFVDRMKENKSPFLLPATVTKEGEFRNVANMTASSLQRNAKAGQGNPGHPSLQSPLTPGHTLAIEGVQLDLSLSPGSKASGVNGQAEWIIRMGWVGGAPNALNPGNNQATRGIIVEVEYVPLLSMPPDKAQQNPLDVPAILSSFLSSLLPLQQVSPLPQVTVMTSSPQEWESIGVDVTSSMCKTADEKEQTGARSSGTPGMRWEGEERVRRATWTLVKHLKGIGMIA